MPGGRHWFGPGFWKDPYWSPGSGGFRGGGYYGRGSGWGPCRCWYGAPAFYPGPAWQGPGDEKDYLKEQAEFLKAELSELEQRLSELEKD